MLVETWSRGKIGVDQRNKRAIGRGGVCTVFSDANWAPQPEESSETKSNSTEDTERPAMRKQKGRGFKQWLTRSRTVGGQREFCKEIGWDQENIGFRG